MRLRAVKAIVSGRVVEVGGVVSAGVGVGVDAVEAPGDVDESFAAEPAVGRFAVEAVVAGRVVQVGRIVSAGVAVGIDAIESPNNVDKPVADHRTDSRLPKKPIIAAGIVEVCHVVPAVAEHRDERGIGHVDPVSGPDDGGLMGTHPHRVVSRRAVDDDTVVARAAVDREGNEFRQSDRVFDAV